jgi:hypothetical protein
MPGLTQHRHGGSYRADGEGRCHRPRCDRRIRPNDPVTAYAVGHIPQRTTCRELVELYLRRVYLSAIAGHEHPPDETVPLARHSLNVPGESSSLIFIPNEITKARAIDYCFLPRRRCQRPLAEASTARNALAVCFDTTLVLLDYLTIRGRELAAS